MSKIVHVAVAVIYFNHQYLLGYRNANQHQGNRYEFIGGKIEADETPRQGLIREVREEIGIDICQNVIIKMGIIRHDYPDKSVALHCFKIALNDSQFKQLQGETGNEGQTITWVKKADLLAKKYPLPEANTRILDWLTLPDTIFISQSLTAFNNASDWVDFYAKKLPPNAVIYCRLQTNVSSSFSAISALLKQRTDVLPLIPFGVWQTFSHQFMDSNSVMHLTHAELMTVDFEVLPKDVAYFASCHDQNSLSKLNELVQSHTVIGCFLSPVKATPTHPDEQGMGWLAFGELAKICDVPVFALGGLRQADLANAYEYGAMGVAGIRLLSQVNAL